MRLIEREMNSAIQNEQNWQKDNTMVVNNDGVSEVFLHGNKIAEVGDTFIRLFDGGFQSKTTKSRLNAILREHGAGGERVFQKKGEWFLDFQGGPIPFFSGMRLN